MPNLIQIYLFAPDAETRQLIKASLVDSHSEFKITEIASGQIRTLISPDTPNSVLIFPENAIAPGLLVEFLATNNPGLICLRENGAINPVRSDQGMQLISCPQPELFRLPALVKEMLARRNRQLLLDYFFRENKTSTMGKLLSGFAHNLSAPLTGILGYAEILRSSHPALSEIQQIIDQTRRIEFALRNLILRNMRLEEKHLSLIDLNELLKNEIQFLQANMVFKHELTKNLDFTERLPKFTAIYPDISQCLATFLLFCISAAKLSESKALGIRTCFDEDYVILELRHSGQPFPLAEISTSTIAGNFGMTEFGEHLPAEWLSQYFGIFLAYQKLVATPAIIRLLNESTGEETIQIKFNRTNASHSEEQF